MKSKDFIYKKLGKKKCEICGKIDELRPYGKNNEWICYECGQKNEDITIRKMTAHILLLGNEN